MAFMDTLKEMVVGSYSYIDKKSRRWFLHVSPGRGETKLFYFSKDPKESISLPSDRTVVESPRTGLPIVKMKFKQNK
jgi:hypothetical protein